MYTVHGFFALASLAAVETTLKGARICPSSKLLSVGQMMAIVVASATIIRGLFIFVRMFIAQREGFVNLFQVQVSWPLSLDVAATSFFGPKPTYRLVPKFQDRLTGGAQSPDSHNGTAPRADCQIRLGSILRSSTNVDSIIDVINAPGNTTRTTERNLNEKAPPQDLVLDYVARDRSVSIEEIETATFDPTREQVNECISNIDTAGTVSLRTGSSRSKGSGGV
ncbi:hypothetical protein B0T25DRAFT_320392 [Lasiosphaeria hispida]|uniref:Transmembrane protein n=1 Tax=Lasiosphaeria hispida TaxID=260671 RepID=A0AAJ0M9N5_9PEZI|nr:hypothetical protein B0T25DRAFT_320392 [Lasiosphaeria hispida]